MTYLRELNIYNYDIKKLINRTEVELRSFIVYVLNKTNKKIRKISSIKKKKNIFNNKIPINYKDILNYNIAELLNFIVKNYNYFNDYISLNSKEINLILNSIDRYITIGNLPFNKVDFENLIKICQDILPLNKDYFIIFSTHLDILIQELNNTSLQHNFNKLYLCNHNLKISEPSLDTFIGRINEKDDLKADLSGSSSVISVNGIGGVGKTTLLQHTLRELIIENKHGYDYIVWTSAKIKELTADGIREIVPSVQTLNDLYHKIISLVYFKKDVNDYSETVNWDNELLKTVALHILTDFKVLLVIDNYETICDNIEIREFIKNFNRLKDSTGKSIDSKIILTTRKPFDGVNRPISGLPISEAEELVELICKKENIKRQLSEVSKKDILQLINSTKGNPLAIIWCIKRYTLKSNKKSLSEIFRDSTKVSDISNQNTLIEFTLQDIIDALTNDEKKVLFLLSYLNESLTTKIICFYLEMERPIVNETISSLENLCLLNKVIEKDNIITYSIHELIKEFICKTFDMKQTKDTIYENRQTFEKLVENYEKVLIEDYEYDDIEAGEMIKSICSIEDKIDVKEAIDINNKYKNKEIEYSAAFKQINQIESKNIEVKLILSLLQSSYSIDNNCFEEENIIKFLIDDDEYYENARVWRIYGKNERKRMEYNSINNKSIKAIDSEFDDPQYSAIQKFIEAKNLDPTNLKSTVSLAYCKKFDINKRTNIDLERTLNETIEMLQDHLSQMENSQINNSNYQDRQKIWLIYMMLYDTLKELAMYHKRKSKKIYLYESYIKDCYDYINKAITSKNYGNPDLALQVKLLFISNEMANIHLRNYKNKSNSDPTRTEDLEKAMEYLKIIPDYIKLNVKQYPSKHPKNLRKYFNALFESYCTLCTIKHLENDPINAKIYYEYAYSTFKLNKNKLVSRANNNDDDIAHEESFINKLKEINRFDNDVFKSSGLIISIKEGKPSNELNNNIFINLCDVIKPPRIITAKISTTINNHDNELIKFNKLKENKTIFQYDCMYNEQKKFFYGFNLVETSEVSDKDIKEYYGKTLCGELVEANQNKGSDKNPGGKIKCFNNDIEYLYLYQYFDDSSKVLLEPRPLENLNDRITSGNAKVTFKEYLLPNKNFTLQIQLCNTNDCSKCKKRTMLSNSN